MAEDAEGKNKTTSEPEFRAFRRRVFIGVFLLSVVGLPIGIALKLPHVWGLSIAGIVVADIRLTIMKR